MAEAARSVESSTCKVFAIPIMNIKIISIFVVVENAVICVNTSIMINNRDAGHLLI